MASIYGSNRDIFPPADNTKTLPFECTYSNCIMRFETLKEMKRHKHEAPDHYYCKKCDQDHEDWEALTQHKVTEMSPWVDGPMRGNREVLPKHIVCEFCGIEYKTFGARRMHREQCHPAEQNITCPFEECRTIFTKAAEFVRHIEDGRCEMVAPKQFKAYLEQVHVNKQIMKDTSIAERLQESQVAARIRSGLMFEDDDTESGGVPLSVAPSIVDSEEDSTRSLYKALEPERELISFHEPYSPSIASSSTQWLTPSTRARGSTRSPSVSSRTAVSDAGTEMSANDYAARISKLKLSSEGSRNGSIYTESFPSLRSPSYASSVTSGGASNSTQVYQGRSAWTTGATSQALFPDAKATPPSEFDDDDESVIDSPTDLRVARWWDPDDEEFQPDFFKAKDELMASRTFTCPFADCEDTHGYDSIDVLKAHLRHTHLTMDFQCPCCFKTFARPSALVAHSESSGKCKVQGSAYFKGLIEDISAGFLKAKRVPVPKIFRQDKAMVLKNGKPVKGIMQTEFEAKMPRTK